MLKGLITSIKPESLLISFVAAAVCGLFWGLLYLREGSLVPVMISHALWDVMTFVLFPLN